jgi:hypothetical protein
LCGARVSARARRSADRDQHDRERLFWTSTQLFTVSSSFKNPISPGGRILDIVMEAYAIIVIATLAGALGTFLQKRGLEIESGRH